MQIRALAPVVVLLLSGCRAPARSRRDPAPFWPSCSPSCSATCRCSRQQPVPAYFAAYTLHDNRSTQMFASFGAIDRSDESRQRFATVEVRVGDYLLDNTHPMRGDARAMSNRAARQVSLPLTDDEKPIRLALWRATDRTLQAGDRGADAREDERRREGEGRGSGARFLARGAGGARRTRRSSYSLDTRAWEARLRRVSALFSGRSAHSSQQRVADGRGRQPLLHQQRRLADRHRRYRLPASSFRA